MVGHTHEDIDAMFGNFGRWFRKNNALSVDELVMGCKEANKNVRDVFILREIYVVKGWFLPVTDELWNHSNPHIIRIKYKDCALQLSVQSETSWILLHLQIVFKNVSVSIS
uniref:DUF7869 domain-containing protein n=1 Tax=Amphimedon queenslandica TaxID=400682 RepID=A0A1X7V7C9_AMPQE